MLYLITGTDEIARSLVAMGAPGGVGLGYISQPGSNPPPESGWWAADNGCFTAGENFDPEQWFAWLTRLAPHAHRCLFAVLPDVPFDHKGTLERSMPWAARVRALGFQVALAMQNGSEDDPGLPWGEIDCAFLAGNTEWKIGAPAHRVALQAQAHGKWVHMGRVNSKKRLVKAAVMGCDSADGTFLRYGPSTNLPRLLVWLDTVSANPTLPIEEQMDIRHPRPARPACTHWSDPFGWCRDLWTRRYMIGDRCRMHAPGATEAHCAHRVPWSEECGRCLDIWSRQA